jgi:uncharacterized protein YcaQ
MDRKTEKLKVNAVHAEPNAPESAETAQTVAHTIEELGTFLGASDICYSPHVPAFWKKALH